MAFRNVIDHFPDDTSTDEPAIEALIAAKGFRLVYAPKAIVYNRGPERREFCQAAATDLRREQCASRCDIGYFTSSLNLRHVLPLAVEAIRKLSTILRLDRRRHGRGMLGTPARRCSMRLRHREEVVWRHGPIDEDRRGALPSH